MLGELVAIERIYEQDEKELIEWLQIMPNHDENTVAEKTPAQILKEFGGITLERKIVENIL